MLIGGGDSMARRRNIGFAWNDEVGNYCRAYMRSMWKTPEFFKPLQQLEFHTISREDLGESMMNFLYKRGEYEIISKGFSTDEAEQLAKEFGVW